MPVSAQNEFSTVYYRYVSKKRQIIMFMSYPLEMKKNV